MGTCYGYNDMEKEMLVWKYVEAASDLVMLNYTRGQMTLRYIEECNDEIVFVIRGLFIKHVTAHAMAASGEEFGGTCTPFYSSYCVTDKNADDEFKTFFKDFTTVILSIAQRSFTLLDESISRSAPPGIYPTFLPQMIQKRRT